MKIINQTLFFGIFFLTFLGYYAILLFLFNSGFSEFSRSVTVPIRVLIMFFILTLVWFNRSNLNSNSAIKWFLVFIGIYCYRLFIEYNNDVNYYIPVSDVFMYFLAFCVVPFLGLVTQKIDYKTLNFVFKSFLYGGLVFSILSIFSYQQFIGEVARLSESSIGESVLSPLAMSYSSALTIGIMLFYFLTNKVSIKLKIFILIIIGISVIPFFLGASRGALIALIVPLILYFVTGKGVMFFLKAIILLAIFTMLLVYLDSELNSGLLDRFLSISEAIDKGESSAIRAVIWNQSFNQFIHSPIIGSTIVVTGWGSYPHNIFIETLQTTGTLGFISIFFLTLKGFKSCLHIFRNHKKYIWVTIIFIQAFIQNFFSGALYTAVWFWTGLALVLATDSFLKKNAKKFLLNQ